MSDGKRHKGIFWGDGGVLDVDCGSWSHGCIYLLKLIDFFTSNVCILLYVNHTTTTTKEEEMRNWGILRVYSGKTEKGRIKETFGDKITY